MVFWFNCLWLCFVGIVLWLLCDSAVLFGASGWLVGWLVYLLV